MTSTATSSRRARPCWLDWKACAVPAKLVVMSEDSVWRAADCTWATASLSPVPGLTSNERVTAGSCPPWFTVSGPSPVSRLATAPRGTSAPRLEARAVLVKRRDVGALQRELVLALGEAAPDPHRRRVLQEHTDPRHRSELGPELADHLVGGEAALRARLETDEQPALVPHAGA